MGAPEQHASASRPKILASKGNTGPLFSIWSNTFAELQYLWTHGVCPNWVGRALLRGNGVRLRLGRRRRGHAQAGMATHGACRPINTQAHSPAHARLRGEWSASQ